MRQRSRRSRPVYYRTIQRSFNRAGVALNYAFSWVNGLSWFTDKLSRRRQRSIGNLFGFTTCMQVTTHYQDKSAVDEPPFSCDSCEHNYDEGGHLLWPKRCSTCNTMLCRWTRMKVWKEAVLRRPTGTRVRLLTFTRRHEPVPAVFDCAGQLKNRPSIESLTSPMVRDFRRLARSAHWKRAIAGWLWVAECTQRLENHCDDSFTRIDEMGCVALPRLGYSWVTHPHIHVVTVGKFVDIHQLNALAQSYGFGTVNIRAVNNSSKALSYLSTYLGKEQPVARSRDSGGVLRTLCREVRLEQEAARLRSAEDNQ